MTHICVTRSPQWVNICLLTALLISFTSSICFVTLVCSGKSITVNSLRPNDAYMRRQTNNNWFRKRLVAWTAPSHYLNQCWNIVNWALGTNFSEILIEIQTFSLKKIRLKMSSAKCCSFRLGLNVLKGEVISLSWIINRQTITSETL